MFPTCTQFRAGDRVGYESEGVDPGWAVGVVTRAGVRATVKRCALREAARQHRGISEAMASGVSLLDWYQQPLW